ncbi:S26 family signal peptidase [Pelagibacterium luteolum]|uniref:Conjugative transfer signal peptidase TraF n=1 Tax=Pelagibacterium luteolum TaxID=440168 RepID=A0A1G7YIX7_9HYPH|nr:S26 family signal peptidase [Pelagibacterium luteolum]SDG96528.1 conjugative transfer signal peptidase TraF [Pelagibacterium luteolum]
MTRFTWAMSTYLASVAIGVTALLDPPQALIWNASPSVPIGLFTVHPASALEVADLVAVMPPDALAALLAERGYLPRGVPMLKRVLGLAGQEVCRIDRTITVDGITMGAVLDRDSQGRDLPAWHGCRVIAPGEIFLMNWQSADSFDGRYFGPLPVTAIIGQALPFWTDEEGDGRYQWRAPTR